MLRYRFPDASARCITTRGPVDTDNGSTRQGSVTSSGTFAVSGPLARSMVKVY